MNGPSLMSNCLLIILVIGSCVTFGGLASRFSKCCFHSFILSWFAAFSFALAVLFLSIIWKSNLTDKMKRSLFQAAVVSVLLYRCTTWTQTKLLEKKLDGNYTRMLRAILNKSWQQHPTRRQLYGHLPPVTKTIQARRTRHAGHARTRS